MYPAGFVFSFGLCPGIPLCGSLAQITPAKSFQPRVGYEVRKLLHVDTLLLQSTETRYNVEV